MIPARDMRGANPIIEVSRQPFEPAGAVGVNESLNLLVFSGLNGGFGCGP
jgi:hypothetical protein